MEMRLRPCGIISAQGRKVARCTYSAQRDERGMSETLVKALSITEDLLTASIGGRDRPRQIV
jgi:hypothetical protein